MKKIGFFLFAITSFLSLNIQAQNGENIYNAPQLSSKGVIHNVKPPFYAIKMYHDLYEVGFNEINNLNKDWIKSVDVYKDDQALDLFGKKAKHGAVIVSIKEGEEQKVLEYLKIH